MSESLGPGATFAGCRIEDVAGRGGMGVVFRATQIALQRPVALKAIAPELAADEGFRERFQRESHIAASIDHPNVIPVYEAGELDGTLYLIMRWVDGTDLRTEVAHAGRLPPARAVQLLRPVAAALAVAHRRGLVHRDVKPANVLIAHGEVEEEDHVYLTDFGIARRTDVDSATRTGLFVGTVDYTSPERFEGGKGDPASDIYSFGCMLFEALTGHIPYDRPSGISKIHAHMTDPIPSARAEVPEIPAQLEAIITKAMAKRPEDRFASAGELTAALGQALQEVETVGATPQTDDAPAGEATVITDDEATRIAAAAAAPLVEAPTAVDDPGPTRIETPVATGPAQPPEPPAERSTVSAPPPKRRSPFLWAAPLILVTLVVVLVATFSDVHTNSGMTTTTDTTVDKIRLTGGGMTVGRTVGLGGAPGSVSVGKKNVWTSVPGADQLVRSSLTTAAKSDYPASTRPTALTAGFAALWVALSGSNELGQFIGDTGKQVGTTKLPGSPNAVAFATDDGSAWVSDSSGAVTHVAVGGGVVGTPAHTSPPATSLAWGEGWVWATNGAAKGLIRVSLDTSGASSAYQAGQRPVGVALDNGVWTANADGHVVRFDPRVLSVNADVATPASALDAIAAIDPGPFVWAMSKDRKAVYRISNTSKPAVTGAILFPSAPVALAVTPAAVWVATDDNRVTQIRYQ
jgi:serine/threonine protein kinase